MSDWLLSDGSVFAGPTDINETYGFVYKITHNDTGKFYIGVKLLWKPKYNIVKGKKKKSMIQSDWRGYWSSSAKLQSDVAEFGEDAFKREILHLVKWRGMCKYLETKEIILHRCLELTNDECYNGILGAKIHKRCVRY